MLWAKFKIKIEIKNPPQKNCLAKSALTKEEAKRTGAGAPLSRLLPETDDLNIAT